VYDQALFLTATKLQKI